MARIGETFNIDDGRGGKIPSSGRIAGNSIFQGDLLIDEEALLKYYPQTAGIVSFCLRPAR
jgi:hypothetical protein